MQYKQTQDRMDMQGTREFQPVPKLSPLVGTWLNTHSAARGIVKIDISQKNGGLSVHVLGADESTPRDWGKVSADIVYPTGIRPHECMGFFAQYTFDFMWTQLQGNMNLGLLILASFNTFTDNSGRANYFAREFFCREHHTHA